MNRREFSVGLGGTAVIATTWGLAAARAATAPAWSVLADVAECCGCAIPCPCNFGRLTDKRCEGNRLIRIREGEFDGASLAGIDLLVAFEMRQWARIYVSDTVNDAQFATLEAALPFAFTGFHKILRSLERVPLEVEARSDRMRFSTPDSTVEMTRMAGLDGAPIRITGLPSPAFHDYVQYEAVVHRHRRDGVDWSYQGTNGFTSVMRARSA
ncbi:MAG: DUF1326 domain-containing protein [Gammaproteobacteria bacterium]